MVRNSIDASLNIFYNDTATMEPLANFNLEQKSRLSDKRNNPVPGDEGMSHLMIIICTRTLLPPIINVGRLMFALSIIFSNLTINI